MNYKPPRKTITLMDGQQIHYEYDRFVRRWRRIREVEKNNKGFGVIHKGFLNWSRK